MIDRLCSIPGCGRKHAARGWCKKHYWRFRRHGDPLGGNTWYATPEESFLARTAPHGECILWTGFKNRDGYGRMKVDGGHEMVHRYAWERVNGPIPDGMFVDHEFHCDPACVKVQHLRLATPAENSSNKSGKQKNNTSGVRNVYRHRRGWQVQVQKDNKAIIFGTYSTIEEAAEVAEKARKTLFGEYAGKG